MPKEDRHEIIKIFKIRRTVFGEQDASFKDVRFCGGFPVGWLIGGNVSRTWPLFHKHSPSFNKRFFLWFPQSVKKGECCVLVNRARPWAAFDAVIAAIPPSNHFRTRPSWSPDFLQSPMTNAHLGIPIAGMSSGFHSVWAKSFGGERKLVKD